MQELCLLLLRAKADPNCCDSITGESPLMEAACLGNRRALRLALTFHTSTAVPEEVVHALASSKGLHGTMKPGRTVFHLNCFALKRGANLLFQPERLGSN